MRNEKSKYRQQGKRTRGVPYPVPDHLYGAMDAAANDFHKPIKVSRSSSQRRDSGLKDCDADIHQKRFPSAHRRP